MKNIGIEVIGLVALGFGFGTQAVIVALVALFVIHLIGYFADTPETPSKTKKNEDVDTSVQKIEKLGRDIAYNCGKIEGKMDAMIKEKSTESIPANDK